MSDTQSISQSVSTSPAIGLVSVPAELTAGVDLMELLDAVPVAGFWKDRDGRFVGGNGLLAELFGLCDPAELVGCCDHDFFPKALADGYRLDDLAVIESGDAVVDWGPTWTRVGGSVRLLSVTRLPVRDLDGLVVGIVGFCQEIAEAELDWHETHDELTGLANRRALMLGTQIEMDAGRCAVMFVDLDQFKIVNESLGHEAGDEVLTAMAARLRHVLPDDVLIARFGGDEFVVVLPAHHQARAEVFGDEILTVLLEPVAIDEIQLFSSASVGIARNNCGQTIAEELVRDSDAAMHRAKALGRARVVVFDPSLRVAAQAELQRRNQVRRAVRDMDFTLLYQPIFSAETGDLECVEALLRWGRDGDELKSPELFLPYLESTGLIHQVGLWVVDEACRQLAEWRSLYPQAAGLAVAVNISRVQFESGELLDDITDRALAHGLDGSALILEVTETAVSMPEADISSKLAAFRQRGFTLAIDDFGVGQSSLAVLCDLPMQIVKIDRSFIASHGDVVATATPTPGVRGRDQVLRSVLDMVRNLGLRATVEGVETEEQYDRLRAMGCDMVQGFWPGRPMPADQIATLFCPPYDGPA